jgi:hypothetical protein
MIAGILVLASPLAVQANSVGCGFGSQLFKGQTDVGPNVMAATTNGSTGNQTFGISSGTLGCNAEDAVPNVAGLFIEHNMERVARDMSTDQGEALETLANLMGIQAADKQAFFEVSQNNFTTIFSHDNVTSSEVIASLHDVMTKDSRLSKYTV